MSVKPEPSESTPPSSPEAMESTPPSSPEAKPVKPNPPPPESIPPSSPEAMESAPPSRDPPHFSTLDSTLDRLRPEDIKTGMTRTPTAVNRAALRMMQRRSYSSTEAASEPVEEWFVDYVRNRVEKSVLSLQSIDEPPTIYRVPEHIDLRLKDIAYKPEVVGIGPFTSVDHSSFPLQKHKWCCVNKLIARHRNLVQSNPIGRCLRAMKALEPRVRSCYSEKIQIHIDDSDDLAQKMSDSDHLAQMMMLDGCFILYLLLNQDVNIHEALKDLEDILVVFGKLWIWTRVKYDLLLLENQIPFFVVKKLFDLLRTPDDEHVNLVNLALKLFSDLQFRRAETLLMRAMPSGQIHHLLHLFYISFVPDGPDQVSVGQLSLPSRTPDWISCAAELREAGIKFKKRKNALNLFDIKFSNGIMEIPALEIHDSSYRLFRNLIAFEQCYPDTQCHITAYAHFMNCLINTPLDMRLLHLGGILTDRTVLPHSPYFFKKLCYLIHVASDKNYLGNVYAEVAKFQGTKWHKWRAVLARDYFNNPWTVISVVAAAVLLLLATIQTFFTIYRYFKPKN